MPVVPAFYPLAVVATDFWNRREIVFESGNLINAIQASMAMPAVFEPVVVNGKVLIDGGAINSLPYDLIQQECDLTIGIDVSGEKTYVPTDPVPNMVESILCTFQIMQAAIVEGKRRFLSPDIYVKPALTNIRVLDSYRYKEILAGVERESQGNVRKSPPLKPGCPSITRITPLLIAALYWWWPGGHLSYQLSRSEIQRVNSLIPYDSLQLSAISGNLKEIVTP